MLGWAQLPIVALPFALFPSVAVAQAPSAPGVHHRELVQLIRQVGYDCRENEPIEVKANLDPAFGSLRPEAFARMEKVSGDEVGPG